MGAYCCQLWLKELFIYSITSILIIFSITFCLIGYLDMKIFNGFFDLLKSPLQSIFMDMKIFIIF